MRTYPFMQVDAFTDKPMSGNPCAVIFDTDAMDEVTMQAIAREMNLSETSFVRKSAKADFGARYFTPAAEIPLAGHPTIATTFAMVDSGRLTLSGDKTEITAVSACGSVSSVLVKNSSFAMAAVRNEFAADSAILAAACPSRL